MTDYLAMYFDKEKYAFKAIPGDETLDREGLNDQISKEIMLIEDERNRKAFESLHSAVFLFSMNNENNDNLVRLYRFVKSYIPGMQLVELQMRKSAKNRTTRKSARKSAKNRTTRKSARKSAKKRSTKKRSTKKRSARKPRKSAKKRSARKSPLRCPTGCTRKSPRQ